MTPASGEHGRLFDLTDEEAGADAAAAAAARPKDDGGPGTPADDGRRTAEPEEMAELRLLHQARANEPR